MAKASKSKLITYIGSTCNGLHVKILTLTPHYHYEAITLVMGVNVHIIMMHVDPDDGINLDRCTYVSRYELVRQFAPVSHVVDSITQG